MRTLRLAWSLLRRDWASGELRALAAALVLAAAGIAAVSLLAQRLQLALAQQASQLLGGDLALIADHPISAEFTGQARALGLQFTQTTRFMSMALAGAPPQAATQLVEVLSVSPGYPLRGELVLRDRADATQTVPAAGHIWVSERSALGAQTGSALQLGQLNLRVSAILLRAPDQALDVFNVAPRVLINAADLPRSGLIASGSRVSYRLLLAGKPGAVERFRAFALPKLQRGERLESVREARPEVRNTLQRAERFLRLSACVAVVLAAVAVAMAARRFMQRHLDACAMLRCLGAGQRRIFALFMSEIALLALGAGVFGAALGWLLHAGLAAAMRGLVAVELPRGNAWPLVQGVLVALTLAVGFVAPALLRLRSVPTLRVLRRELAQDDSLSIGAYLLGLVSLAALVFWQASDAKLALWAVGGFSLLALVMVLAAWAVLWLVTRSNQAGPLWWRQAVGRVRRYTFTSTITVASCSIGIMAILLLAFVRNDLLAAWNAKLPPGAPNRFLVNIQPEQRAEVEEFLTGRGLAQPQLYPVVRARLSAINGKPVSARDYQDVRKQRMVEREFNLSWASQLRADNRVTAGAWWTEPFAPGAAQFSVEEWIARELGIKLGDTLRYHVAGIDVDGVVASIRHVDWDSMQINFYVLARRGDLDDLPVSFIGSFHAAAEQQATLTALVQRFPGLTLVDVDEIVTALRLMVRRVSDAVRLIFALSALAGALAVYTALAVSDEERARESVVLRALGASRKQVLWAQLAEFALIGALAGVIATFGAWALAWAFCNYVMDLPFRMAWDLLPLGVASASLLSIAAAWPRLRGIVATPPWGLLRGSV